MTDLEEDRQKAILSKKVTTFFKQPEPTIQLLVSFLDLLDKEVGEAFLIGGFLRDLYLEKDFNDIDIGVLCDARDLQRFLSGFTCTRRVNNYQMQFFGLNLDIFRFADWVDAHCVTRSTFFLCDGLAWRWDNSKLLVQEGALEDLSTQTLSINTPKMCLNVVKNHRRAVGLQEQGWTLSDECKEFVDKYNAGWKI